MYSGLNEDGYHLVILDPSASILGNSNVINGLVKFESSNYSSHSRRSGRGRNSHSTLEAKDIPERALWIPQDQLMLMSQEGWNQLRPVQRDATQALDTFGRPPAHG